MFRTLWVICLLAVAAAPATAQDEMLRFGNAAMAEGAFDAAVLAYAGAVPALEAAHGPMSVPVADALARQAFALGAMGRYGEAIPLAEQAVAIVDQSVGRNDRGAAFALAALALLLRSSAPGHHETRFADVADPLAWRSLELLEQAPGPDTADVGRMLNGYADLLHFAARDVEGADFEERLARLGVTRAAILPTP
ncbi:MAG: tetratricopeptide repeat protein [Proteobacteria bacterium]|nr:tetratricopeptide repeat protein [Pseudomonadota bacterium]MDA1132477.1 tetratricopeptide repeat protein [Pseudomonadota bacterium]